MEMSKAALSNLLGSIGYSYGTSKVRTYTYIGVVTERQDMSELLELPSVSMFWVSHPSSPHPMSCYNIPSRPM